MVCTQRDRLVVESCKQVWWQASQPSLSHPANALTWHVHAAAAGTLWCKSVGEVRAPTKSRCVCAACRVQQTADRSGSTHDAAGAAHSPPMQSAGRAAPSARRILTVSLPFELATALLVQSAGAICVSTALCGPPGRRGLIGSVWPQLAVSTPALELKATGVHESNQVPAKHAEEQHGGLVGGCCAECTCPPGRSAPPSAVAGAPCHVLCWRREESHAWQPAAAETSVQTVPTYSPPADAGARANAPELMAGITAEQVSVLDS